MDYLLYRNNVDCQGISESEGRGDAGKGEGAMRWNGEKEKGRRVYEAGPSVKDKVDTLTPSRQKSGLRESNIRLVLGIRLLG